MKTFIKIYTLSIVLLTTSAYAQVPVKGNPDVFSPSRGIFLNKDIQYKKIGKVGNAMIDSFVDPERNVVCYYFRKVSSNGASDLQCLPYTKK